MNCCFCPKNLETFEKYITHIALIHSNENNFRVLCNFSNCNKAFTNAYSLKTHVFRKHYKELQSFKTDNTVSNCLTCKNKFKNISSLSSHYREHCNNGEFVSCPFGNCKKVFSIYSSFTSHVARKHNNIVNSLLVSQQSSSNVGLFDQVEYLDLNCLEEGDIHSTVNITRNLALLQLKIQEKYMIPQSTVQKIMQDYKSVLQLNIDHTILRLKCMTQNEGLDKITIERVLSVLENNDLKKGFDELNSIHKRKLYYKNEFKLVEPIDLVLGVNKLSKNCVYQYVPIIESIKFLLNQETILSQVLNPLNTGDRYCDFRDGNYFKKHPIFSNNPHALQIFLYCDEFEVCNPIGVHRKVHKMLAFYFVLGNIYPQFRSTTDCIQLALLCKSVYIKKFGLAKVVQPLIKDLEELGSCGVVVSGIHFYGALCYISADNLASHFIGGFLESFSPNVNKPCRSCLCDKEEIKTTFNDDNVLIRTETNYNLHVTEVLEDPSKVSAYGLKCKSPFIFSHFHVVQGLPPDIAHDILEGVAPYEIGLIIQHLVVVDKLFTLDYVNHKIETFPYGSLDTLDKPCVIPNTFKITQTASRMWCLIRLLPLMCFECIPEDNLYWALYLDLKGIVDIVFGQELSLDNIALLKMKIADHLQFFCELFPNKAIRPKQHFLIHYPRNILNYGPLRKCWTLRYEAKHFYFKRLASIGKNFKQLGSTLAMRHQLHHAYCVGSDSYLKNSVVFGSPKLLSANSLQDDVCSILESNGYIENGVVKVHSFVSVGSLKYTTGMYVCTDVNDDHVLFSSIDYIVSKYENVNFIVRHVDAQFHAHLEAYSVYKTNKWSILCLSKLTNNYPLTSYFCNGLYFIVPKHIFN